VDTAGWIALFVAPGLAFAGIVVGKAMETRNAKRDNALAMINILGDRLAGEEHRARAMEDYALALRGVLITARLDVPPWPPD
jgi:hypothetical protein